MKRGDFLFGVYVGVACAIAVAAIVEYFDEIERRIDYAVKIADGAFDAINSPKDNADA